MNIVLVEPEIHRTRVMCAFVRGHKVPAASHRAVWFQTGYSQLKRAGMITGSTSNGAWAELEGVEEKVLERAAVVIESGGGKNYSDVRFAVDDYLIFRARDGGSAETGCWRKPWTTGCGFRCSMRRHAR